MNIKYAGWARPVWCLLCAGAVASVAGCGGFKLYPVSGVATLDGKPLGQSTISFNPDTAKGNNATVSCVGRTDAQGRYTLKTMAVKGSDNGTGAPAGWYKVTLKTGLPGDPDIAVNPIYLDPTRSPLSVEVVSNPSPNAYDLKFTSK